MYISTYEFLLCIYIYKYTHIQNKQYCFVFLSLLPLYFRILAWKFLKGSDYPEIILHNSLMICP